MSIMTLLLVFCYLPGILTGALFLAVLVGAMVRLLWPVLLFFVGLSAALVCGSVFLMGLGEVAQIFGRGR